MRAKKGRDRPPRAQPPDIFGGTTREQRLQWHGVHTLIRLAAESDGQTLTIHTHEGAWRVSVTKISDIPLEPSPRRLTTRLPGL